MRTAAFPSFRKLYGRILLEENSRLAYTKAQVVHNNATSKKMTTPKLRFPKGFYYIDIEYSENVHSFNNQVVINLNQNQFRNQKIDYPVRQINGRKYFILANTSWLGGKCYFMAWAYIIVGILCFITSVVLLFLHVYYGNMHYNTAILLVDTDSGNIVEDLAE
jgi:hypothetical protein